jgi:hypothetical protein
LPTIKTLINFNGFVVLKKFILSATGVSADDDPDKNEQWRADNLISKFYGRNANL